MKTLSGQCLLLAAMLLTPLATMTSQQTNQVARIPQFENDEVKVWKAIVPRDAPLAMHTHEHARVIVALAGGTMKIVNEVGPAEVQHWETGKAYWLSAEEGRKRHADANEGDKPIEVMVIELKNAK
jgi:hypothetical protein